MNWNRRLARAEKCGRFTDDDITLASKWLTCAVGEHRGEYDQGIGGTPNSDALIRIGMRFALAVRHQDSASAAGAYAAIERWFRRYGKPKEER